MRVVVVLLVCLFNDNSQRMAICTFFDVRAENSRWNSFKFWVSALRLSLLFFAGSISFLSSIFIIILRECAFDLYFLFFGSVHWMACSAENRVETIFSLCWQRWCNTNSTSKTTTAQEKQNTQHKTKTYRAEQRWKWEKRETREKKKRGERRTTTTLREQNKT